jgi:FAD/FMN-containing dehydrogenase
LTMAGGNLALRNGRGMESIIVLTISSTCTGVVIDPAAKTAVIQGGATLGDINEEMGVYDLMFPLGHYRRTGIGLILGGGLGVAARKFGVASDHLLSVTLVTAQG